MKTVYFINKEKRTIVSKLTLRTYPDGVAGEVVGIAKCNPEDEWNEELGRKVANARAHLEYHREMSALCRKELKAIEEKYRQVATKVNHHEDVIDSLVRKLNEIKLGV